MFQKIASSANRLNWGGWLLGLWSAFIVGATGAAGAAGGGAAIGVQGFENYLKLMGATFLTSGTVSVLAFLHNHPAPDFDGTNDKSLGGGA